MNKPTCHFTPPFSAANAIRPSSSTALPPAFQRDGRLEDTRKNVYAFLEIDLRTPKLNKIHPFLWLAGLPRPPRPLHRQKLLGRTVYATESPDEHLVWHETHIFIKPLPEYILEYEFWEEILCCDETLYKSACGLLLSYVYLVSSRSDFRIAHETGLIPPDIEWTAWMALVRDIVRHIDTQVLNQADSRYMYGELRLSRLNTLYRFGAAGFSSHKLVYGYTSGSKTYKAFFERNFGWLFVVFIYITVVLSAMQVALATDSIGKDVRFQAFCYGVALTSIGFVVAAVLAVVAVWSGLFWFHLSSTIQYRRKAGLRERQHSS